LIPLIELPAMSAPTEPLDTPALIRQRLVGLAVLLGALFLFSLLLSRCTREASEEALPAVVIPLGGTLSEPVAALASEAELEAEVPVLSETTEPAPAPATPPTAAKVASSAPPARVEKPAAAPKHAAKEPPPAVKPAPAKPAAEPWFVVVGAYKNPDAAKAIANRVRLAGFKAEVIGITGSDGDRLQRVRAGPFKNATEAESARATLIVEGLTKSIVSGGR
jgi:cell division protein FtsN